MITDTTQPKSAAKDPPVALGDAGDDEPVATAEQIAAIDFEPIDNADMLADFTEPNYSSVIADIGIDLRIAAATVGKTKSELVTMAREMENDEFFKVVDRLIYTEKRLESLTKIVGAAVARTMAAISVVATEPAERPAA